MRLILTGGGSGDKTKEIDLAFSKLLDKSKPLLYIPIAINNAKHPYDSCLDFIKSTFDNLGVSLYEVFDEAGLEKMENISPEDYSGVYIGGGNTPYLLKKLKETSAWNFLQKCVDSNLPIYGGSAGAIIFGKTIEPCFAHDKNWVELQDLSGFDVLDGKSIWCHYRSDEESKIFNFLKLGMEETYVLSEKNALYLNDGKIELIGQEDAFLFKPDGSKENLKISHR